MVIFMKIAQATRAARLYRHAILNIEGKSHSFFKTIITDPFFGVSVDMKGRELSELRCLDITTYGPRSFFRSLLERSTRENRIQLNPHLILNSTLIGRNEIPESLIVEIERIGQRIIELELRKLILEEEREGVDENLSELIMSLKEARLNYLLSVRETFHLFEP